MPTRTAAEVAGDYLRPVIARASQNGFKTRLAQAMTRATGEPVTRQMVGRWLHPDPEKRTQPALGHGLLLTKLAKSIV